MYICIRAKSFKMELLIGTSVAAHESHALIRYSGFFLNQSSRKQKYAAAIFNTYIYIYIYRERERERERA